MPTAKRRQGGRATTPQAKVGPGGSALCVEPDLKASNLRHLRRIEGQVRGLAAMVEDDRYCADIIVQIAAVRESLQSVARNAMRNHLNQCASEAIRAGGRPQGQMIEELLKLTRLMSR